MGMYCVEKQHPVVNRINMLRTTQQVRSIFTGVMKVGDGHVPQHEKV